MDLAGPSLLTVFMSLLMLSLREDLFQTFLNKSLLTAHGITTIKDAMEVGTSGLGIIFSLETVSLKLRITDTPPKTKLVMLQVKPESHPSLATPKLPRTTRASKLPSPKDPSQSQSTHPTGAATKRASSPFAETESTTQSPSSASTRMRTLGSLETPGVPDGEKTVTSESA